MAGAYADLSDLLARAGRLRDAWDTTTKPTIAEVEGFLDDAASEIDAFVASRGFQTPVEDPVAAPSLRNATADMALLLALRATWPGGSGPDAVKDLLTDVSKRVDGYRAAMVDGSLPALLLLASQAGATMQGGADNFWSEEGPEYEYWVRLTAYWPRFWETDPWGVPASMQPEFRRGQRF